jgi:hypothetical protein
MFKQTRGPPLLIIFERHQKFITLDNQFYIHDDKKSSLQRYSTGRIIRVAARRQLLHEKTQVDWYLIISCW